MRHGCVFGLLIGLIGGALVARAADDPEPLPGTRPLTWDGDLAARLVEGADRFLLRKTEESVAGRAKHWNRDFASLEAYERSIEPNRKRLAHILGVRDERVGFESFELTAFNSKNGAEYFRQPDEKLRIIPIRWPVIGDVHAEGYVLLPTRSWAVEVILLPDADQTPEQLIGIAEGLPPERQFARRLAESGCGVYVISPINRDLETRNGRALLTSREFLQRPAYELGRTLHGYEVQAVLTLLEFLRPSATWDGMETEVGIVGYGEGGMVALSAAALDTRIQAVLISGCFDDRLRTWQEPVDRNMFGLLDQFGGAELASLVAPWRLVIEASAWPEVEIAAGKQGAPGRLVTPPLDAVKAEVGRARELTAGLAQNMGIELVVSGDQGDGPFASDVALQAFLNAFRKRPTLAPVRPTLSGWKSDPDFINDWTRRRQTRQIHEIDRHTQQLLIESPYVRAEFLKKLDTSSPEAYAKSVEEYRRIFRDEVIGHFDEPLLTPDPRSRKVFDEEMYTGYEVVLDVWPEVFAYGILLVPKGIAEGERRPLVVCQHGLEGRPRDLADPTVNNPAYNQFAIRLAERGFVTFAPQNLYIGGDKFRTLQRKANPLGKTLFSIIVPQHRQITGWLKSLPFVDPKRIAFYGLSYGGKSAMRIPPLVEDYCLSICSADFNEWVWKNASTRSPYSYVWTNEYEIFEWDLGSTFNYAEMAALIAPRPFMVERGHFDGVAPDETVGYEFAKVRHLYAARLKLPPETCQIEWFVGPHTIHGVGTFAFLHRHLDWPIREDQPLVPLNK
jgi:dienelactone hydrolase